jgi:hypothetical protein
MGCDWNLEPMGLFSNRLNAVQRQTEINLDRRSSLLDLSPCLEPCLVRAQHDDCIFRVGWPRSVQVRPTEEESRPRNFIFALPLFDRFEVLHPGPGVTGRGDTTCQGASGPFRSTLHVEMQVHKPRHQRLPPGIDSLRLSRNGKTTNPPHLRNAITPN